MHVFFRYTDTEGRRCTAPRDLRRIPRKGELVQVIDADLEHPRRVWDVLWDLASDEGNAVTVFLGLPVTEEPPL